MGFLIKSFFIIVLGVLSGLYLDPSDMIIAFGILLILFVCVYE